LAQDLGQRDRRQFSRSTRTVDHFREALLSKHAADCTLTGVSDGLGFHADADAAERLLMLRKNYKQWD
jgi:hypothetical protein